LVSHLIPLVNTLSEILDWYSAKIR
jgi:hypothetical protein